MSPSLPARAGATRRILMSADTVGGVWTYALELSRALEPQGLEIVLATMGNPLTREQRQEARAISNLELRESSYKLEWMDAPWDDVARAGDWLLDLEQSYRPDLVQLNGYTHGALPWQAPVIVVAHSCVLSWWRAVHGCPAPAQWNHYRQAVSAGLHAANLVIAPSRTMLEALLQDYGPLAQSRVIANGRRLPPLPSQPKEQLVLTAGRLWDKAKNLEALNAIAPELPWPVYAAGEPLTTQAAPNDGLQLLGRLSGEQLLSWMAKAAIFALPARYEPFGLSALEAALAGCALVLGDIPSLREIWGKGACFVPPDKPQALAAALQQLIAQPARLAELAEQGRAVAAQYAPERMAASYMMAYRYVLEQSQNPGPTEAVAA